MHLLAAHLRDRLAGAAEALRRECPAHGGAARHGLLRRAERDRAAHRVGEGLHHEGRAGQPSRRDDAVHCEPVREVVSLAAG